MTLSSVGSVSWKRLSLKLSLANPSQTNFPSGHRSFSEADDADLTDKFSKVEQERDLDGMHERYAAEVARWEDENGQLK